MPVYENTKQEVCVEKKMCWPNKISTQRIISNTFVPLLSNSACQSRGLGLYGFHCWPRCAKNMAIPQIPCKRKNHKTANTTILQEYIVPKDIIVTNIQE